MEGFVWEQRGCQKAKKLSQFSTEAQKYRDREMGMGRKKPASIYRHFNPQQTPLPSFALSPSLPSV